MSMDRLGFTGRGLCPECGGSFTLSGGSTIRAHKKPGQPDRNRWCIGSNEKPQALQRSISGSGRVWVGREAAIALRSARSGQEAEHG